MVQSFASRHFLTWCLMVQMGLAWAADPYYQTEDAYAKALQRGVWRPEQGRPL
jgi:hypothetical protein